MDQQALLVLTAVGTLLTAVFTGYPILQRAIAKFEHVFYRLNP